MTVSILIVYAYSCTKGIAFVSENDLKKNSQKWLNRLQNFAYVIDKLSGYAFQPLCLQTVKHFHNIKTFVFCNTNRSVDFPFFLFFINNIFKTIDIIHFYKKPAFCREYKCLEHQLPRNSWRKYGGPKNEAFSQTRTVACTCTCLLKCNTK